MASKFGGIQVDDLSVDTPTSKFGGIAYEDTAPAMDESVKAGDFSRSLAAGLNRLGQLGGRAIDVAGNYAPFDPTKYIRDDEQGILDLAGQKIEGYYKTKAEEDIADMSPAMKKARELKYTGDSDKTFAEDPIGRTTNLFKGPAWKSPAKVVGSLLESAPSTALGMGTGMAVTGGLIKMGVSSGLAGVAGGAVGEGSLAGAESGKDVYDLVVSNPVENMVDIPEFQAAYESLEGMPEEERMIAARKLVASHSAIKAGLLVGAGTGVLGAPSGAVVGKIIGKEATGGVIKSAVKGGVGEGFQEAAQSPLEKVVYNYNAIKNKTPESLSIKNVWDGVDEAAVEGFVTGVAMGAGGAGGARAFKGGKVDKTTQPDIGEVPTMSPEDVQFIKDIEAGIKSTEPGSLTPEDAASFAQDPELSHLAPALNKIVADAKTFEGMSDGRKSALKDAIAKASREFTADEIAMEQEILKQRADAVQPKAVQTVQELNQNIIDNIDQIEQEVLQGRVSPETIQSLKEKRQQLADFQEAEAGFEKQAEEVKTQKATQAQINQARINAALSEEEQLDREENQALAGQSDFLQKLDLMQNEVANTQAGGVTQEKVGQEGETVRFKASSPGWMQQLQADRKTAGKKQLSRKELNTLFDKKRNNLPLTDIQNEQYKDLEKAINQYQGETGEFAAQEQANDLEKRGFEVLGEQQIPAGDLEKGDTIVGTVDGVNDEYTVVDTDDRGNVVLRDGITKRVDMFDDITVEGLKKSKVTKQKSDGTMETGIKEGPVTDQEAVKIDEAPQVEEKKQDISIDFNEQYPGMNLRYNGTYDRTAINKPDLHQFTPQAGPLKGRTIAVEELSVEAVKNKLDSVETKEAPTEKEEKFDPLSILTSETKPQGKEPLSKGAKTKENIDKAISVFKSEIEDWESRIYKSNKKIVSAGGKSDNLNAGQVSINKANENRRSRNIEDRESSIAELEEIKKRIDSGESKTQVLGELLDSKHTQLVDFAKSELGFDSNKTNAENVEAIFLQKKPKEQPILKPGTTIQWESPGGKTITGKLVTENKKTWTVEKADGKKVQVITAKIEPSPKVEIKEATKKEPGKEVKAERIKVDRNIDTVESFNAIEKDLHQGKTTPEQLKSDFESIVENKEQIIAELTKLPKSSKKKGVKTLLGMMGAMGQYRYKSEKKEAAVKAIYQHMMGTFNLSSGLQYDPFTKDAYITALRKKVDNTTQENIDDHAAAVKKNTEEYIAERKKVIKGVTNPETLEDFKNFFDYAKDKTLTPEQQERYDTLKSDSMSDEQKAELEKKSTLKAVKADTDFEIIEGVHTKKGHDIFTVKMTNRVDKETFSELRSKAKKIGGYYSMYRGNGAIPGFVFTEKSQAEKFISLKEGDVSVKEELVQKTSDKEKSNIARLKFMADKEESKGKEKLNQDRLTNTSKRAGQAASAEADVRSSIAFAKTLRQIAEGIESGDVKYISGIKNKSQLNTLFRMLVEARNIANSKADLDKLGFNEREAARKREPEHSDIVHATLPKLTNGASPFNSFLNDVDDANIPGTKLLVNRLRKLVPKNNENSISFSHYRSEEDLRSLLKKAKVYNKNRSSSQREVYLPWYVDEQLQNLDRLARMGITTDEQARSALRELSNLNVETEKEDPIKVAERKLVGKKPGVDFFPTPKTIANELVDRADIQEGETVLEPSAGKGDIADAIKENHPDNKLDTVELSSTLRELLKLKGHEVVEFDFMDHTGEYDKIIMNPPFSKGMDVEHVKHAYSLLKPGGKIVAIMGEHPFFANDKKSKEFREWISDKGFDEKLPEGSFKGKEAFRQTGVNSRVVEIEKPTTSIREALGKANTKIISEDGRAYILEDLVSVVYKSGMSIKEFTGKIADKLGNAYDKVKDAVKKMYHAINAHLDTFTSGPEVGAISVDKPKKKPLTFAELKARSKTLRKKPLTFAEMKGKATTDQKLKATEKLHNTTNQTAEKNGLRYQGTPEQGMAAINNMFATLRKTATTKVDVAKADISKEQKTIEEYRKLEKLAKDPHSSVASKQKMLASFLKVLPVNVRSKVITPLTFISRYKQVGTQDKRINEALAVAEKELVNYFRRDIIAGIKKGITPKKLAKNRIKKGTIGHEAERDLQFIRETLKDEEIESRMFKIENQIAKKELELEEADESKTAIIEEEISDLQSHRNIIETFGDLKSQKLEDLLFAKEAMDSIISEGRSLWRLQQDTFKETLEPMTDRVQQDISGQEEPILETSAEATKRELKKQSMWGKGKGTWDAVENSILSWEFLMNKLSKLSGDKVLQSYTTTEMGSIAQAATKEENLFNIETDNAIHLKAKEIFNAKSDKDLNKKFIEQEKKQAGKVFSYDEEDNQVDDFAISQMEAAYMYAVRKNPDSIPTFDKMGMTDQTFKEIENFIGPELTAWVDYNVDEYLQDFHFSVNEVYRKVFGTNLTKTPGYISWYRDVPGKAQEKTLSANPSETGAKGMAKGAFKERVKNTNPFRFTSFNDVLTRHVSEMNNFKAWAMPTKMINGVFNNRKTQRLITQHHSANMGKAIKSFQADFAKSPIEMRGEMAWLDKMRGNITTAMTALNPTIFLKQLTSIPAMAESIPTKEWIKYEAVFWANPLKAWNLLKESKHWESRRTQGMERDIRTAQSVSGSQAVANVRNLKNRAMFLVKWGDGAAILVGGYPVYKYHFDKNVGKLGREKAHQLALTKFETAMDRTQQSSGVKDQGKFQRSGSYAKLFSMFMTAPKQYTSQITAAIRQIHSNPKDGDAYKRLFIFGVMMPSLFQATASGLVGLIGGDEEDENKFVSNQIKAILQSPLNGVPIIRDLQKGVWESAMGEWYGTDVEFSPVTEAAQSLLDAVFNGARLLADEDMTSEKRGKHWEKTINNVFETVGYAYGLPVETVRKMFMENWADVVSGKTDYPIRRSIGFSRYATGEKGNKYSSNIAHVKKINKQIKEFPEKEEELQKDKTYEMLREVKRAEKRIRKINKRLKRSDGKEKLELENEKDQIKEFFNKKFIQKKNE